MCDEDAFDSLFGELITDYKEYDSSKFADTLKMVQDRYDCLGISCSLVGRSSVSSDSWPKCQDSADPSLVLDVAGYSPTTKVSSEVSCFKNFSGLI